MWPISGLRGGTGAYSEAQSSRRRGGASSVQFSPVLLSNYTALRDF